MDYRLSQKGEKNVKGKKHLLCLNLFWHSSENILEVTRVHNKEFNKIFYKEVFFFVFQKFNEKY